MRASTMTGNQFHPSSTDHIELQREVQDAWTRRYEQMQQPVFRALYGVTPRQPTRMERLKDAFAWRIDRVKDAWAVLMGDAYAERD